MITLNPSDTTLVLSGGNLIGTNNTGAGLGARATVARTTAAGGKYYYEVKILVVTGTNNISCGFGKAGVGLAGAVGNAAGEVGFRGSSDLITRDATENITAAFGATIIANDIIGCGVDMTTRLAIFTLNGVASSGNITTAVGSGEDLFPRVGALDNTSSILCNFGGDPTVPIMYLPAGYLTWDPLIKASVLRRPVLSPRPIHHIRL